MEDGDQTCCSFLQFSRQKELQFPAVKPANKLIIPVHTANLSNLFSLKSSFVWSLLSFGLLNGLGQSLKHHHNSQHNNNNNSGSESSSEDGVFGETFGIGIVSLAGSPMSLLNQSSSFDCPSLPPLGPVLPVNYADIELLSDIEFTEDSQGHRQAVDSSARHSKKHSKRKTKRKSSKSKKIHQDQPVRADTLQVFRQSNLQNQQVSSPNMTRNSTNSKNAGTVIDSEALAKMQKQLASLAEKNDELEKQVTEMAAKKEESNDDANSEDEESDSDDDETPRSTLVKNTKSMKKKIGFAMRDYLFCKVKFVNSATMAKPLMISLLKFIKGDKIFASLTEKYVNEWCRIYLEAFRVSLSARRTYCQQEMKKGAFKLLASNEGPLPSKEDIKRCALREVNLEDPNDLATFTFYWKFVLASHGGFSCWNHQDKIYYGSTPGTVFYNLDTCGDEELLVFTPETEGMFANCPF